MNRRKIAGIIVTFIFAISTLVIISIATSNRYFQEAQATIKDVPAVFPYVWVDTAKRIRQVGTGANGSDEDVRRKNLDKYEKAKVLLEKALKINPWHKEARRLYDHITPLLQEWHQRNSLE